MFPDKYTTLDVSFISFVVAADSEVNDMNGMSMSVPSR
jgi:hypothetical protein